MPRRELKNGKQVADWTAELAASLTSTAEMIIIGSGALLWHAFDRGLTAELPEASMELIPPLTAMKLRCIAIMRSLEANSNEFTAGT